MSNKYRVIKEDGAHEFSGNNLFDGLACEEEVLGAFVLWCKIPRLRKECGKRWHRAPFNPSVFYKKGGGEEEWREIDLLAYHNVKSHYIVPIQNGGIYLYNDSVGFTVPVRNIGSVLVHIVEEGADMQKIYPDLDLLVCKNGLLDVRRELFVDGLVGKIEKTHSFGKGNYYYYFCPDVSLLIIKKESSF